jgi:ABC-type molybdate transport system permease subunit
MALVGGTILLLAAQEALQAVNIWESLRPRLVYGENIQQTFQFADSGNAEAAIVSFSLAVGKGGKFLPIPDNLHRPLRQALAVVKSTQQPMAARRFIAFVLSTEGQAILRKYGLALPQRRGKGDFGATLMVAGDIPGVTRTMPLAVYDAVYVEDTVTTRVFVLLLSAICILFAVIASLLAARHDRG